MAPYSVVRGSSVLVGVSRKYKFANREIGVPEFWRVALYSVVRGSLVLVGVSRKYKFANREIGVPGEFAPLGLMDGVLMRL